ncbi:hypothetical protein E4T50_04163 [Aureobasidium sp. EXF-12298]|nr:hypothetical protein E4T50_04163 [Aureobasidium sp. EXF-12298]KAI4765347.1 hypothetical protein E4T51_01709 [Aureobasidium sp. EXF-12344]KAI4783147.1 hypothetical protein E4T52_01910 [Aureobasidium sp. EXF-3400]
MEIIDSRFSYEEYIELVYARRKERGEEDAPFIDILKEVFEDTIQSDEAASRASSFVFSYDGFLSVYSGVLSTIVGAAHQLSEEGDLHRLANFVLALSRLGDVRNESAETLHLSFHGKKYEIEPGQIIKVDDGKLWSDLPHFLAEFCENMQGPTAYLNFGRPEHIAEQEWTNANTFAAYLVHNNNNSPCSFDHLYTIGFRTLANSLEWNARTVEGMDSLHSLRAALRWMKTAGQDLWHKSSWEGGWAVAGPLWREIVDAEDGWSEGDETKYTSITTTRWLWWAERLNELAEGNMIDDESKALARASAETIKSFELDWVGSGRPDEES